MIWLGGLVILTLSSAVEGADYFGGSMSFETEWKGGKCHVKLLLLTGWRLGDGPCGQTCSEADMGNSTKLGWNSIPSNKNDINYFGQFFTDFEGSSNRTPSVPNNREDMLQLVNVKSKWEMESSVMNFVLDEDADIIYEGNSWIPFENVITRADPKQKTNLGGRWHMQVKIDGNRRIIDKKLGPPNSSPVVLTKPYYEFGTDKDYTVRLPVIDFDGDKWRCRKAFFQESGTFISAYEKFNKFNTYHTVFEEECKVRVISSRMKEGDTGVVAVTVTDMLRKDTMFEHSEGIRQSDEILSAVSIQFYYRIKENVSNPFFLTPPTPNDSQVYVIHVGAKFTVDVYASTHHTQRTIKSIDFLRRDTKYVERTEMKNANLPTHPQAVVVTAVWKPSMDEIGKHIMCANVRDSAGVDSVDLQCFIIEIRAAIKDSAVSSISGPTFINFPSEEELICHLHAFCRFPIYAATSTQGGIIMINGSSDEVTNLTVIDRDSPVPVQLQNHQNAWRSEIQYFANLPGIKTICLEALDSKYSVRQCLKVKILGQDPCEKDPCGQHARCISDADLLNFECVCVKGYKGKFCNETISEKKEELKCYNGGTPSTVGPFCVCTADYTTDNCAHAKSTCLPDPCTTNNGICDQQNVTFKCRDVFSQNEICQQGCGSSAICRSGQCQCPIGFSNPPTCGQVKGKTGNFKSQFVPPTPSMGSEISCNTNERDCIFPVYVESSDQPNITAELKGKVLGLPHLKIEISTAVITGIQGMNNVYRADINFNKDDMLMPPLPQYNLCLFVHDKEGDKIVSMISSLMNIFDYRCVIITYIPKAFSYQKKNLDFVAPTPPEESVVACVINNPCHFFVYTDPASPHDCSSKPVVSDRESGVGIFPALDVHGICQTDVSYVDVSHSHKRRVCLKSRIDGSPRCFFLLVTKDNDECKSNPQMCKNSGLCQPFANGTSICHCPIKYSGKRCEIGPCSASICHDNGECYDDGTKQMCFCKLGYSGEHCQNPDANVPSTQIATFMDYTYSKTVNCYVDRACFIPYIISAKSGSRPVVAPGFHSPDIDFKSVEIHEDQTSRGKFHSVVEVIGHNIGNRKVCIKTRGETGKSNDETCVNVHVMQGPAPIPDKIKPYFVKPTLTDKSHVECKVGSTCRMNLWVSNDEFLTPCPEVLSNKRPSDGVYVFQHPNEDSPCKVEAVFKTDHAKRFEVCFTPFTPKHSIAGGSGKPRCYEMDIRQNLTVLSPCNYKQCQHGGFCNTESGQANCICMVGYSGDTCQQERAEPQNGPPNGFGDMAQMKSVSCYLNTECSLPFSFNDPSPSLSVTIGAQDDDLEIVASPSKNFTKLSAGSYQGIMTVISTTKKTHTLCLQRTQGTSHVLEEYCFRIKTLDKASFNPMQPHFSPPSLPTNSDVYCIPGKACHILTSMSAGSQKECPELERNVGDPLILHVFHSNTDKEVVGTCAADITLNPPLTKTGSERYCFTAVLSQHGIVGERRCFKVHFESPKSTFCQQHHCRNQGVCIAHSSNKIQSLQCLCSIGKFGQSCDKEGYTIQTKHSSKTSSAPEPIFIETAVPKTIPCNVNEPCGIPLLLTGPKSNISLCGTDTSMTIEHSLEEISSLKLYLVNIKIISKSTGVETVCVQSSPAPKENQKICFFVNSTVRGNSIQHNGPKVIRDPTTPDGSVFECEVQSTCHIILHTTINSGQCNKISQVNYPKSTRIVGYSKLKKDSCLTDVATYCEDGHILKIICLWEDDSNSDQRCIHVQCTDNIKPLTNQCPRPTSVQSTTMTFTTSTSDTASTAESTSTMSATSPGVAIQITASEQYDSSTTNSNIHSSSSAQSLTTSSKSSETPAKQSTLTTNAITKKNVVTMSSTETTTKASVRKSAETSSTTGQISLQSTTEKSSATILGETSTSSITSKGSKTEKSSDTQPMTSKNALSSTVTSAVPGAGQASTPDTTLATSYVSKHQSSQDTFGCLTLTPETARDAASNGRVQCTCYVDGQAKQVITLKPKVTNAQLFRAAGIGAGSVTGAMAIAMIIYVVVSKLSAKSSKAYTNSRKQKPCKRTR